ncbi:hypothetical protein [Mycolicibacter algericus]|uniref:hypothetical protein n=1 Tax=Mycolicibacter algericus TaxID=1288388 RepID=UPI001F355B57|nr:hypothetical protein [Mycolicibacter algericus]
MSHPENQPESFSSTGGAASDPRSALRHRDPGIPAAQDKWPAPWLIVASVAAALALIFFLGVGYGLQWGAQQWGPVAVWIGTAATFAAVVVALVQSRAAQRTAQQQELDRRIDHEVSRRRECIRALSDLWGGINSLNLDFRAYVLYLRHSLPPNFNSKDQHPDAAPGQTYSNVNYNELHKFVAKRADNLETPLFYAMALLNGTPMDAALDQLQERVNSWHDEIYAIQRDLTDGARPCLDLWVQAWDDVLALRPEHLDLTRQHFGLVRADIASHIRS